MIDHPVAIAAAPKKPLPGWPRVLGEAWAAAYVGLSPSAFLRGPARELAAIALTAQRRGWLRDDLDAWIDRRAGRQGAGASSWDDMDG
jgi:hypothetical protein